MLAGLFSGSLTGPFSAHFHTQSSPICLGMVQPKGGWLPFINCQSRHSLTDMAIPIWSTPQLRLPQVTLYHAKMTVEANRTIVPGLDVMFSLVMCFDSRNNLLEFPVVNFAGARIIEEIISLWTCL